MRTRRSFLQTTLASAGGLSTLTFAQSPRTGCGLAIGTYGLQSMKLEEAIDLVAKTGYNAIEISSMPGTTGAPSILATEDRKRLRQILADSGLRLCGIMADLQPKRLEADHKAQLAEVYHLIKLGHDLSPDRAPVVQTILGGKNWEESRDLFRDRVADWVQIAGDLRGSLSIKPHRQHAMSLPTEANWLIEQLGAPERLGMVYDYSHYAFRDPEVTIEASAKDSLPHLNYVATKDAVKEGDKVNFALAGESGSWDHATIISALYDGGYRGDFCCEVSSQIWRNKPAYDPVAATKTCFENLKGAFERAGVARR
ncbi:MAG: sugar phosphate isomerase/epimerase [Verrucomicrobiales bacterium]|nr:sugar phosphate isomerase/epimerase [Verrucomicrobiales bacterium]